MSWHGRVLSWILVAAAGSGSVHAASDPASLCDRAAEIAAAETGVPLSVLLAIARAETGRRRQGLLAPWPWTVNMEGAGRWFETSAEALAYVEKSRANGSRSFDIGCFQINHLWHGDAFSSVEAMFDPVTNARYAAQFLETLYRDTGSWTTAAGYYHSRTPDRATRYAERFERIRQGLAKHAEPGEDAPARIAMAEVPDAPEGADDNAFPLLLTKSAGLRGSLVPIAETPGLAPLFAPQPKALY